MSMNVIDLIAKKRDGGELSADEIGWLVGGFARGDIPDYQAAAWLMAVFIRGMSQAETAALTLAMAHSGDVLDLSDVKRALSSTGSAIQPVVIADKHSTGGVGDKTTITVAPLVAACGVPVGKMSGRGLGHTGGTLDKLEAIPGFNVDFTVEQFKRQLREIGIVIAGQTQQLAPADGRLYALRDVTATVASLPLIASSIMSKKIAAGADAIVLDVKVGRGAFMQSQADALALAQAMVEMGKRVARKVSAVIADMNQPLGYAVGNSLEVMEALAALRPPSPQDKGTERTHVGADFREHCLAVAAELLQLVGRAEDEAHARSLLHTAITSGRALAKSREWIGAQGGDARVVDDFALLPRALLVEALPSPQPGYVTALDALAVGASAMRLGAGRVKKAEPIDPAVGIVLHKKIGDTIARDEPLLTIYANDRTKLDRERDSLLAAYQIASTPPRARPHVHQIVR